MESLGASGALPGFALAVSQPEETGTTPVGRASEWVDAPRRLVQRRRKNAHKTVIISLAAILSLTAVVFALLRCAKLLSSPHTPASDSLRLLASKDANKSCGSVRRGQTNPLGSRGAHYRSHASLLTTQLRAPGGRHDPPFYEFPTVLSISAREGLRRFMKGLGNLRKLHLSGKQKKVDFLMDGVLISLEFSETKSSSLQFGPSKRDLEIAGRHMEAAIWRRVHDVWSNRPNPSTSSEEFMIPGRAVNGSGASIHCLVFCRWDPELSSSGPSSPSSPFDRVVAGDFGGEPSSAVFQFPNVGGPSQEDSADDAYASSHTQSQGPPKIPGAQEDQDGSSPGRTDSDTPSGEKIPEQIQASSGAVSSWQHDSRRRPLVQPEDIWLPRVEPSDGHEESGTVTAGERKHKGGGGELVRSSSFARPSRGTDGGQEDTDSKDADASGRPRTSSAGRGHVQTWLGDRHASLRYSFEGVKDKMVKEKLEEAVGAARKMCIPAKRLRTETIQFEHGGVEVEITVTELIGFNWESTWLVKQVGTQLEQAYLSALEEVKSPGSGNWSTMRTFSVTHERGGRVDGQLAVSVTATHVQPLPLQFPSLRRGARLQESSRARSEVDVFRGGALPAPRQTKSEGVSSPGSTGSSDDDS